MNNFVFYDRLKKKKEWKLIFLWKKRNALTSPLKSLWKKPLFGLGDFSLSDDTVPSVSYALISSKHPVSIIFKHMKYKWNIHKSLSNKFQIISIYSGWVLLTFKNSSAKLHHCLQKEPRADTDSPCALNQLKKSSESTHTGKGQLLPGFFCTLVFLLLMVQ